MIYQFDGFEVDADKFELRHDGLPVATEPQVLSLLLLLAESGGRLVSKDEIVDRIWSGRIVSDAAITSRIKSARQLLGDDGDRQAAIRTIRGKGVRFVPEVTRLGITENIGDDTSLPSNAVHRSPGPLPPQHVRFCRAPDGTGIAYSVVGSGPPLVKTANWLNHLEFEWESPIWRHWLAELAGRHTLLRYDERGNGLSDWRVENLSFDAFVEDLELVVDAAGFDRFDLLGISQGCAVSIAYAVKHPERVRRMVLYGGYAQGWKARNDPVELAFRETMLAAIETGWGRDNPAFRQLFTSLYFPDATVEQADWFNEMQRVSTSPSGAVRLSLVLGAIDVTSLLERVEAQTLVIHARDDAVIPASASRYIASKIPNARFVELDSRNHLVLEHEPAWSRLVQQLRSFLDESD